MYLCDINVGYTIKRMHHEYYIILTTIIFGCHNIPYYYNIIYRYRTRVSDLMSVLSISVLCEYINYYNIDDGVVDTDQEPADRPSCHPRHPLSPSVRRSLIISL